MHVAVWSASVHCATTGTAFDSAALPLRAMSVISATCIIEPLSCSTRCVYTTVPAPWPPDLCYSAVLFIYSSTLVSLHVTHLRHDPEAFSSYRVIFPFTFQPYFPSVKDPILGVPDTIQYFSNAACRPDVCWSAVLLNSSMLMSQKRGRPACATAQGLNPKFLATKEEVLKLIGDRKAVLEAELRIRMGNNADISKALRYVPGHHLITAKC